MYKDTWPGRKLLVLRQYFHLRNLTGLHPVVSGVAYRSEQMLLPASWRWSGPVSGPAPAVVFDIDGVLANADERQHMINGKDCNWPAFFAACGQDRVIDETSRLLEVIGADTKIILLTGRPIGIEAQTLEWLTRNKLRWDLLIMREHGTYESSLIFKREAVRTLKNNGFDLRLAFEDDQKNLEMLEDEGVPCIYIHSGYYDARDSAAAEEAVG